MLQAPPGALGGDRRHKSAISTSLWKGRCWWSIALPHSAHTSLAVLTSLLSFFGGKEYHGVLGFIMGKEKFLAFSHSNLHISNLWEKALLSVCMSVWASCGLALTPIHCVSGNLWWVHDTASKALRMKMMCQRMAQGCFIPLLCGQDLSF